MDFKNDLFKGPTTYLNDYCKHSVSRREKVDCEEYYAENVPKTKPLIMIDQETFLPLRKRIPLNLMIIPDQITRFNPHTKAKQNVLPVIDERKDEVIKTRPRVYFSPQVSLDDVPDPEMRKLLIDYTYTTDFRKAEKELLSVIGMEDREVPTTVLEHDNFTPKECKHYFSVYFKPKQLLFKNLSEDLNRKGAQWTNEQVVAVANADELFWKNKDIKCGACFNPLLNLVDKEKKEEIRQLVEKDCLRMPYDKKMPGYAGFSPEMIVGIEMQKKDLPSSHPLVSISQVVSRRAGKDKKCSQI